MNIYFVRHGETDSNKNKLYYGKSDIKLNSKGIDQGKKVKKILQGIKFDIIYASESTRTFEMAQIINKYNTLIKRDGRINEMNLGVFEGKNYEQLQKQYPKELKLWSKHWKGYAPPKGESYSELYKRVESFMNEIKNKHYKNLLIVTHSGVIRSVYCYILNGILDSFWKFSSKNGDISLIKYEYGNWYIDYIEHLKE